jgi:hypothetical protein
VAQLLSSGAFAQQLAVTAKAAALRRFHPQVIAQKHLEIYREVLARK